MDQKQQIFIVGGSICSKKEKGKSKGSALARTQHRNLSGKY